jgi:Uma2 family endonuclease
MARRKVLDPPAAGQPPERLRRFLVSDWIDLAEQPPPWWASQENEWRQVRALRRYLDARRAWHATHS